MTRRDDKTPRRQDDKSPNADMLRHDIDRGKTGDKTNFPDPAAAPLGTDAEAGGNAPASEEVHRAREEETKRPDEDEASRKRPNSAADPD